MSNRYNSESRSLTPQLPQSPNTALDRAAFFDHWMANYSSPPRTPPPPPAHPPLPQRLIQTQNSRDADDNWLIPHLDSTIQVDDRVLRKTVLKLQPFAVDNAIAHAASEIQRLDLRLGVIIDNAKAPELGITISKKAMTGDRDREWEIGLDFIIDLEIHNKVDYLQAARREIVWLSSETSRLEMEISIRRADWNAGRPIVVRPYNFSVR